MLTYELTAAAEEDLRTIARYTLKEWGETQLWRYADLLEKRMEAIAEGAAHSRTFSKRFPEVWVTRCEHHYIFYLHPQGRVPQIIAVLHEKMDLVQRLKHRLE
ncbi:type II toxin-antitoxin system RelE/ParE family toxin [Methylomarinum vadi]|uniref:type II toxin-antitoxin system RelE/ParE family toxin n=1 Tax=Methylomarinum vadi TaxID=438855 RepID=UPI0004DEE1AA|nr:type II toxin-antitoxin system RelE/ParE family toxin [Methylomarinum vadi]